MSSSTPPPLPPPDALVSAFITIYGTLLVLGSIVSIIFAVAMFRGRKVLGQWPFYRIVQSLMSLDTIYLLVQLTSVLPQMTTTDPGSNATVDVNATLAAANAWYNTKFVLAVRSIFDFLPSKGLLYLTLLMALNRLAVFVVPSLRTLFEKRFINWTLTSRWMLVLLFSILCVLVRPTQKFDRSSLRFEDSGETILNAPWLRQIVDYSDYVVPIAMFIFYLIIYWSIQKKRRVISSATLSLELRSRVPDDNRMLLQAIIICIFLQLYYIVAFVESVMESRDTADYVLNMLKLILSVTNHSIHATIFLFTNSTIRGFLPSVSCCKAKYARMKAESQSSSMIK